MTRLISLPDCLDLHALAQQLHVTQQLHIHWPVDGEQHAHRVRDHDHHAGVVIVAHVAVQPGAVAVLEPCALALDLLALAAGALVVPGKVAAGGQTGRRQQGGSSRLAAGRESGWCAAAGRDRSGLLRFGSLWPAGQYSRDGGDVPPCAHGYTHREAQQPLSKRPSSRADPRAAAVLGQPHTHTCRDVPVQPAIAAAALVDAPGVRLRRRGRRTAAAAAAGVSTDTRAGAPFADATGDGWPRPLAVLTP